jgi:uncharacterized membrane protein
MDQQLGMDRPMETLEHSIEVDAPLNVTYNQWTQFEEFPRFMDGVESVTQIDDRRLHWVARVAGKRQEWDAEITRQVPDQEINWMGLGDPDNRGRLVFQPVGERTKVTMTLDYAPEGAVEAMGDRLGLIRRRIRGDMDRFKEFIETRGGETGGWRGEINADGA